MPQKIIYKAAVIPISSKEHKISTTPKTIYVSKTKKSKSDTNVSMVRVQLPFWAKILVFLLYAILIYLAFELFLPLLSFQLYIAWWKRNGGNKYNDIFSIYLLAYREKFVLYYYILSLTKGSTLSITEDQATFIFAMMTNFGKYNEDDDVGFLLPIHICENITVDIEPPVDELGWHDLFQKWGYPEYKTFSGQVSELLQILGDPDNIHKWTKEDNGNFLYHRYNILSTSPFLVSWFTGSYNGLQGEVWDPLAFKIAVGLNPIPGGGSALIGGWWGYCKYGITVKGFSNLVSYVYTTYTEQQTFTPQAKCDGHSGLSISGKALQGIATGAMAGAPFVTTTGGPVGAIIGAVVMGGFTLFTSLHDAKCI